MRRSFAALRMTSLSREILFLENLAMMQLVPGNDVGEGPYGNFILVGHAATRPCRLVQVAQQGQGCAAYGDVVLNDLGERRLRERTIADVVVLLEAFHRRLVPARDS